LPDPRLSMTKDDFDLWISVIGTKQASQHVRCSVGIGGKADVDGLERRESSPRHYTRLMRPMPLHDGENRARLRGGARR
jgi:hypothetical protein